MKMNILTVIITIIIVIQSYLIGYNVCEAHYKNYYNATERIIDSIDDNYFIDVLMETDEYQEYLNAKADL